MPPRDEARKTVLAYWKTAFSNPRKTVQQDVFDDSYVFWSRTPVREKNAKRFSAGRFQFCEKKTVFPGQALRDLQLTGKQLGDYSDFFEDRNPRRVAPKDTPVTSPTRSLQTLATFLQRSRTSRSTHCCACRTYKVRHSKLQIQINNGDPSDSGE